MTTTINPTKRRSLPPVGSEPVTSTGHAPPVLLRLPDVSQAETDSEASPAVASWLIMAMVAIGLLGLAYWWINRGGKTTSPPVDEAPAWNGGESDEAPAKNQASQPPAGDAVMPAPPCSMPHNPAVAHRPPPLGGPDYHTSMRTAIVPPRRPSAASGIARHRSPKPVQPGVARLQGTIEKAPIESRYEHSRPSFY